MKLHDPNSLTRGEIFLMLERYSHTPKNIPPMILRKSLNFTGKKATRYPQWREKRQSEKDGDYNFKEVRATR